MRPSCRPQPMKVSLSSHHRSQRNYQCIGCIPDRSYRSDFELEAKGIRDPEEGREKRRELEALRVQFDVSYIAKLTRDEATHQQNIKALTAWTPHLAELKKQRGEVLRSRAARERVATIHDAFGRQASQTLAEALSDPRVSLKYTRNAYSPVVVDQII